MGGFSAIFSRLEDPRTGNARRHDLCELLVIALCSCLCGGTTCTDMAEFAEDKEPFLRDFLTLKNGLPSHDTFSRLFRLLVNVRHAAVRPEDGHAQMPQVLGLGHFGQQDARADRVGAEGVDHRLDGPLDNVVGQHDEHRAPLGEVRGQTEGLRDTTRLLLVGVGELIDPVLAPVSQKAQELTGVGTPGDEHDLVDAARDHGLNRPGDHGAVVNRQEVLVRNPGQGVQA